MKANHDKFQFIILGKTSQAHIICMRDRYTVDRCDKLGLYKISLICHTNYTIDSKLTYSRKNPNWWGEAGGLRIWNFQGYQRNSMWNFQGWKMMWNFQGVTIPRKNNVEFLWIFGFCIGISKGSNTTYSGICRGWALFCLEFPGFRVNDSLAGGEGGEGLPLPPSLFFFWNSLLNFKEHINNIVKRVSNIRKSQNLNLLNDRKSICLLI